MHTETATQTQTAAFVYARISLDRDGTSTAPERQIADARALIAARGWREAGVYVDRDASASRPGVERPEFERLLREAAAYGDSGAGLAMIVAQNQDRLTRQTGDSERLLNLAAHGVGFVTVIGDTGSGDTADPMIRMMIRQKAVYAMAESEQKAQRHRRKHREMAEQGVGHGSRHRAFGHDRAWRIVPAEAEVVRELAERALHGETIASLVRDLNRRGILTTSGRPWRYQPLASMLRQARLAGARELDGELIATGAIEPIISVGELIELRSALATRKRSGTRTNARKHVLSGYLFCGACGARMVALPQPRGLRYSCPLPSNPHRPGCGTISVTAAPVEAIVRESVIAVLQVDPLAELIAAEESDDTTVRDALAELRAVDARAVDLNNDYADGIIERREYRRMVDRLAARREAAELIVREAEHGEARANLPLGEHAAAAWDDGDLHTRREILDALGVRVTIVPPRKLGRVFDRERVRIEFAE